MSELCFIVEGRHLYMDQVLIDYNEDPVFYVCKDDENYYLVLCTDIENMKYYISEVSLHIVSEMINGENPMRNAFLQGRSFWMVSASDTPENDIVTAVKVEEINIADLPKDNARFESYSPELQAYGRKIESYDVTHIALLAQKEKRSIIEVSFEEDDGHAHEISCAALGEALSNLQNLVCSLAYKEDKTFGQLPRMIRDQYELKVTDTFAASFGVQLKTRELDDEDKQKEFDEVFEKLDGLIAVSESSDSLKKVLGNGSRRAFVYYNDFLNGLKRNNLGLRFNSASPFRGFDSRHMSTTQVGSVLQRIGKDIKKIKKEEQFEGTLKGIDIDKKRFTFIAKVDGEEVTINGTISKEMTEERFTVPWNTKVIVETTTSFDKTTGKEKHAFNLVKVG